jgi:hypothetical protein
MDVTGIMMIHIQSWKKLFREVSSAVSIYCFGPQKTNFISGLIDRTLTDITQVALN